MKKLFLALLLVSMFPIMAMAANQPAAPVDAYSKAVSEYIDASKRQLAAYKGEVASLTVKATAETKQRLSDVSAKLGQCDKLVDKLAKASRADFDKIKAEYETARDDMAKTWEALKKDVAS